MIYSPCVCVCVCVCVYVCTRARARARLMFLNSRTLDRTLVNKLCNTLLQEYVDTLMYIIQTIQKFAQ